MRKYCLLATIMLLSLSVSAVSLKSNSFNIEFTKSGVYEFAFYESKDSTEEIRNIAFAPEDKTQLANNKAVYRAAFGVKWNIQSPLAYTLSLEFSSSTTGSATADYMLKRVNSSSSGADGLNFSLRVDNGDEIEIKDSDITSVISREKRMVVVKEGTADETERNGGEDIYLTLNPPDAGFSTGQYLGYVRLILSVG